MARLPDADQGGLPVPRFDFGCAHRARPGALPRPGEAQLGAVRVGHPGVAQLLLQVADDRARTVSGARPVHPTDEAEEHATSPDGRAADYAPRAGVLRLKLSALSCQ